MDQVNQNATFHHDDVFQRLRFAKLGMKLIDEHPADKGACTIAVDASWGIGKSTFLHMWRHEIRASRVVADNDPAVGDKVFFDRANRVAVYYNAWEHDDSSDAFAPLLWTIISTLVSDRYQEGMQLSADKVLEAVSFVTTAFAAFQPQNAAAVAIAAVSNAAKSSMATLKNNAASKNVVDAIFQQQQDQQNNKAELRRCLSNLACACGKLVIFVDELDRCKPSFAIDTLETIKHYFDIPNLAFVFAVDQLQLCHAIAGRYGNEMDAGGYFSKFIDHHLMLPKPTARQMIRMVNSSVKLSAMQEEDIEKIFHACDISPREIPRIYAANDTLLDQIDTFGWDTSERLILTTILTLFLCMKHRKPDIYAAYMSSKGEWDHYGWQSGYPKLYSFLSKLGHYRSLLSDECTKDWTPLTNQRVSSSDDQYGVNYRVAFFGLAVISTNRGTDKKSLIRILHEWLETIEI